MENDTGQQGSRKTVLAIEDDGDIGDLLRYSLEREGFRALVATDGERGLQEAFRCIPDLILLDLMLPGMDGLEVCRRLRASEGCASVPILMVTAKDEEADVVVGLELGADDYISKPFSPRELIARVRAGIRRSEGLLARDGKTRLKIDGLTLDSARHEVLNSGQPVPLTRAEFRLLWTLVKKPGRVFERAELVERITAGESYIIDRNVDVHISSIRKKLGAAGDLIGTVRGVGYKCRD